MIFGATQFEQETIDKIKQAVAAADDMALMMAMFLIFDRGVGWERERIIPIIQRLAIDPMRIVNEIRKPIR